MSLNFPEFRQDVEQPLQICRNLKLFEAPKGDFWLPLERFKFLLEELVDLIDLARELLGVDSLQAI